MLELCPFTHDIELMVKFYCVSLLLVIAQLSETGATPPSYKWTFNVYYNSSSVDDVTTPCGTHYAETFLGSFVQSASWLEEQCLDQGVTSGLLKVNIAHRATVSLFKTQVAVSVNIYLSSLGGGKDVLSECGSTINETLNDPTMLAQSDFLEKIRYLEGKTDNDTLCVAAILSPHHFYYERVVWKCEANYTYVEDTWHCVPDGDLSSDETPVRTSDNDAGIPDVTTIRGVTQHIHYTTPSGGSPVIVPPYTPVTAPPTPTGSWPITSHTHHDVTSTHPLDQSWGIELLESPPMIELIEGGVETKLDVRFWANRSVLCDGVSSPEHCHITVNISIAGGLYSSPICRRTGKSIPQVVFGEPTWAGVARSSYCAIHVPDELTEDGQSAGIILRAVQDNKYDGEQYRQLSLGLTVSKQLGDQTEVFTKTVHRRPIKITDRDRKATCQSINDPHVTTFDGLEYNNYYEGEFILYSHKELPARVDVVYQRCSESVQASCNCAVAVQSGDDVLVIDRCYRDRKPLPRISGHTRDFNRMAVQLFLNGQLTPGTRIYQEADGKKYFIYLPHGVFVKVMISGMLINAWIVASPADLGKTKGLCGLYDADISTDMVFRNNTPYTDNDILKGSRGQPVPLVLDWRVDIDGDESLLQGVTAMKKPYIPPKYCLCEEDSTTEPYCDYSTHIDNCDILKGVDVTEKLIQNALKPVHTGANRHRRDLSETRLNRLPDTKLSRHRRDIEDNTNSVIRRDPILVDKDFVPPKYKWLDDSKWNEASAKDFCSQYVRDNYIIGQLCARNVPSVNFKQEIQTCAEDIQITGNTSWSSSARDAMKEQCLEEIQKNGSLPNDVASHIEQSICINDCSMHGKCVNSVCRCDAGYSSADCSISELSSPYAAEMPHYGLCDIRNMNCTRVIVYGDNFINSPSLTCYFQECEVTDTTYIPKATVLTGKAMYINFNAVECVVPEIRSYLISVSNNGVNKSDPLLFMPFDPQCNMCNAFNTTCSKVRNSCIIDDLCYAADDTSPTDNCMTCEPMNDELQWTTLDNKKCHLPWWTNFKLPNWAVAVPAAIGGSIVGVLAGFLLYKCCCKNHNKQRNSGPVDLLTNHVPEEGAFEDAILHRHRGLPVFSNQRFPDVAPDDDSYNERYFYNDGRGVENGVHSTTYF